VTEAKKHGRECGGGSRSGGRRRRRRKRGSGRRRTIRRTIGHDIYNAAARTVPTVEWSNRRNERRSRDKRTDQSSKRVLGKKSEGKRVQSSVA
jgi:hypothetical protein